MRVRCLSAVELEQWLLKEGDDGDSRGVRHLMDASQNWTVEIAGVTYFLTQVVLRHRLSAERVEEVLNQFERQSEEMWFTMEDCGVAFIDFLLRNRRRVGLTLSQEIMECVEDCFEHRYHKTVRM